MEVNFLQPVCKLVLPKYRKYFKYNQCSPMSNFKRYNSFFTKSVMDGSTTMEVCISTLLLYALYFSLPSSLVMIIRCLAVRERLEQSSTIHLYLILNQKKQAKQTSFPPFLVSNNHYPKREPFVYFFIQIVEDLLS